MEENNNILLFDGVCNLCNYAVQFVIKRDKNALIKFASLQSEIGQKILAQHRLSSNQFNSFVYVKNNQIFLKSTAALHLTKDIGNIWKLLYAFIIVPKFIRDFVYDVVAKNRYKWFGKRDVCMIPSLEFKNRFIDY